MRWTQLMAAWLASMAIASSAADLGRLFFTPQERDNLDRQRRGEKSQSTAAPTLNGYIKRSDGRNTIWVDGGPLRATDRQVNQAVVDGNPAEKSDIRIKRSTEQESTHKAEPQKQPGRPARVPQPAVKRAPATPAASGG